MRNSRLLGWLAVGIAIGFAASWFITASWKHLIFTAVCALFIRIGFDSTRARASWARLIFSVVGGVGILYTFTAFLVDSHAVTFSRGDIALPLATARGLILRLILALAVSGQLLGQKQEHCV